MFGLENACPYLQGTCDGARCRIEDAFIRESSGADIHVCLSDGFEGCTVLRCYNEEAAII
ncbi:MAG: hypothetical protein A2X93_09060 [Deltaproteobacteria bacterium GWC2_56_8]|nr:MAG: hypothetical protein A2X99_00960 [Deltaproteobacteria bacterium GWB2_55_19]OGP34886.1 MAG: hypothetical protein A2X93_09060 [Deltaproteobacteria bacterium GWC2_56_8]HAO93495.1 hypothetical protein [Deltaproteobacteria bacterium]